MQLLLQYAISKAGQSMYSAIIHCQLDDQDEILQANRRIAPRPQTYALPTVDPEKADTSHCSTLSHEIMVSWYWRRHFSG